ncbi:hypothetical protein JCGZ_24113 [Jatropha curcas]|uniref:Uncharacterized protein n=1 Tax=Jatropha curcas TaxID=180498 RepID=A0A067LQN8_JATCU|nr:hypothetical protein JCGZ_24113 [Jatropha curcas]
MAQNSLDPSSSLFFSSSSRKQGAAPLLLPLLVSGHRSTKARWRSARLVLVVVSPASSRAERASMGAKRSCCPRQLVLTKFRRSTPFPAASRRGTCFNRLLSSQRVSFSHQFRRQSLPDENAMNGGGEATVRVIFGETRLTQSKLITDPESP